MFDSTIIDVALGLTFVFLVLSFCTSALVEAIADRRQWRGRMLHAKLRAILGDTLVEHFYLERRVTDLASGHSGEPSGASKGEPLDRPDIIDAGLHAHFTGTSRKAAQFIARRMGARRLPSYIPESVFADILLDWLQGVGLPEPLRPGSAQAAPIDERLGRLLERMNRRADGDQAALRSELVDWFKQTMDRASGEFKRRSRVALLVLGALLVLSTNADTLRIVQRLQEDGPLRAGLAASAENLAEACKNVEPPECTKLRQESEAVINGQSSLLASQLLGWRGAHVPKLPEQWPSSVVLVPAPFVAWLGEWARIALGWSITVLAIGLGADFWFGLMKKIIAIKNPKREAAADESKQADIDSQPDTPAPRHVAPREPLDVTHDAVKGLAGFQPQRTGESNVHAYWMAQFASLAYRSPKEINGSRFVSQHGLQHEFIEQGSTQAFVFHNASVFVVAFRGTEKNLGDWKTDIDAALGRVWHSPEADKIGVHSGFRKALDQVWGKLEPLIRNATAPIWFTGHSLGGALALLAAYRLQHSTLADEHSIGGVYTFGQPRVGDQGWLENCPASLCDRIFRYVNASDIVPHLPPPVKYRHAGNVRYFDVAGRLHHERTLWERLSEQFAPAFVRVTSEESGWKSEAADYARQRVADHGISRYIECLERVDAVRRLWSGPQDGTQLPTVSVQALLDRIGATQPRLETNS